MTHADQPHTSAAAVRRVAVAVAVAGASGRMGKMLIEAILQDEGCVLAAALDQAGSHSIGTDATAFLGRAEGVLITDDIDSALAQADCLIDFTRPEGTMTHLAACVRTATQLVIGTTGFDEPQKQAIRAASEQTAIVMAPNMSVGVNVTLKLLQMAAKALATGYDIEIVEAHHRHKVDAPSGTALKMGEVIAQSIGRDLSECAVYERVGHTGARKPSSIGFATVRGGDIVGDHTVLFAGTGENIEISHKALSRQTFAQGSVRAVQFLSARTAGLYDMFDVLGLNDD